MPRVERIAAALLACVIVAAALTRLYDSWVYDLSLGHDSRSHAQYLGAMLHFGHVQNRVDYCLPQAYLWTALHGWIASPLLPAGETALQNAALKLGNLHLAIWLYAGLVVLARRLRLSTLATLAFLALAVSAPTVQRSLDMLRPENVMLAFVPWMLAMGVSLTDDLREGRPLTARAVLPLAILAGLVTSEKIGGLTIPIAMAMALLAARSIPFGRRLRTVLVAGALTAAVALPLFVIHKVAVGRWFFQHPTFTDRPVPGYDHVAPLSFYWPIRPADIWRNPVRERQRGSMWGILAADLYGDYWQYGPDHKRFEHPLAWRVAKQRAGLVATVFYLAVLLVAIVTLARNRDGPASFALTMFTLILGGALAYMGLTCQVGFEPKTANLIKWEYIGWCVPLMVLPIALLAEPTRPRWQRAVAVTAALALGTFGTWRSLILG